jgi:hypothetical protein
MRECIIKNTGKKFEELSLEEYTQFYHGRISPHKYVRSLWKTMTKKGSDYRKICIECLKGDTLPRAIYLIHKKSEEEWHKLKEIRFEDKKRSWEMSRSSIDIEEGKTIEEDEYEVRTTWSRMIPTQEKPIVMRTVTEKIANEEMKLMYSFIKENVQGRIYRKPKNVEEFYEDILFYLENRQARRYNQEWEDKLYDVLEEVAPNDDYELWSTKQRIRMFKKQGIELEVYKRLTTKEAQEKKEKEVEKMIKKKTKGMDPCTAYKYRTQVWNEIYGEKKQPDWENEVTMRLMDTYLEEEAEEIENTKSLKWKKFKKMGKKHGIHNMKKKVQKWLCREKSDVRNKIDEVRKKYTRKLEEHKKTMNRIRDIENKNQNNIGYLHVIWANRIFLIIESF